MKIYIIISEKILIWHNLILLYYFVFMFLNSIYIPL